MSNLIVIALLVCILFVVALPSPQITVLEAPSLPKEKIDLDGNATKVIPHPAGDKETVAGIVEKVVEQRDGADKIFFADGNFTTGCYAERFDSEWKPGLKHKILIYTAASDCGGRHIVGVDVVD